MSTQGKQRVNWLAVRTYYIAGHSASQCSQRYGASARQIQRKAAEEGWSDQRKQNVASATQDVAAALDNVQQTAIATVMLTHIQYADRLMQIAIDGEGDLAAMSPGRSKLEARKALLETAERAVRIAREVRGFRTGEASEQNADNDAPSVPVFEIRKDIVHRPREYQEESA